MDIGWVAATTTQGESLAEIRVQAMRESLERIGRFDPQRARDRFLSSFSPECTTVIELAGHVNGAMPEHVVERVSEALNSKGLAVRGSRVHLFGVAYKPDVGDVRESPALDIIGLLHRRGAIVTYTDPYVRTLREGGSVLEGIDTDTAFERGIDCAVITTNHRCLDYEAIAEKSPLVVDTRNALRGIQSANIFRL